MTRIKGGPHRHLRHKKVLKYTKGQRGAKHLLFRRANEAMLKSMWYATRDRRIRKRDLRRLWIARINAAARLNGTTYSLSATATDANNQFTSVPATSRLVIDTTAPNTPVISSPPITNDSTPLFTGTLSRPDRRGRVPFSCRAAQVKPAHSPHP